MSTKKPSPEDNEKWMHDPLDWAYAHGMVDQVLAVVATERRRRRRNRLVGLTAIASVLIAAILITRQTDSIAPLVPSDSEQPRYAILAPESRLLPDGSKLELRPGSIVHVFYTATSTGARRVEVESGTAYFDVQKDPNRPFIVKAQNQEFRAVGTAFSIDVKTTTGQVEMVVAEGRVAVESARQNSTPSGPSLLVESGHSLAAGPDPVEPSDIVPLPQPELDRKLAWRTTRFEFDNVTLKTVVELFNARNAQRIELRNVKLEELRIAGVLSANNAEPLFKLLTDNYGVMVERGADGIVWLQTAGNR